MTAEDNAPYIDDERSASLRDVGSPDYVACTLVNADGEEVLALIYAPSVETDGDGPCVPMSWRATAPHELTGRLPRAYAPKCGHRASTSGKPCQNAVSGYGEACQRHQGLTDAEAGRRALA